MPKELSAEMRERVSIARSAMQMDLPFFGYISMRFRFYAAEPGHNVPTMGVTPDFCLFINEEWASKLTDEEFAGVFMHEVLHPAMFFWERKGDREQVLFNIAHDYAINLIISDMACHSGCRMKVKLPEGGLLDRKYQGMTAEEIYDFLHKEREQSGGQGGSGGDDLSDSWGVGDVRPDLSPTETGKRAASGDQTARDDLKAQAQEILVSATQVREAAAKGSLSRNLQLLVDSITEARIPWSELLAQFLGEAAGQNNFTYRRPSRRQSSGDARLIGRVKSGFPDVTILWDTSGSMRGEEKDILGEVNQIITNMGLTCRVMIVDCSLHYDLRDVDDIVEVVSNLSGGGGSDFNPAFNRLEEEGNDSVVLAFTDGYIAVPEVMPPLLKETVWVLTSDGVDPTNKSWGRVLRMGQSHGNWE